MQWIEDFLDYTEHVTSPEIFRKWSAISTISAAMERRVWSAIPRLAFPNMYVVLVGRPGVGKTEAITEANGIANDSGVIRVAPTDITREGFLDFMADETGARRYQVDGDLLQYQTAFVCAHELGNFIREHDVAMLSVLQEFYDGRTKSFDDIRRSRGDKLGEKMRKIPNPLCSMLGGTTPGHLGSTFPPEAWNHGFLARTILIYSGDRIKPRLFIDPPNQERARKSLVQRLSAIGQLHGKFVWTTEAQEVLTHWLYDLNEAPLPEHPRLANYSTRRMLHIVKLAMVARLARGPALDITGEDVQSAFDLLFAAEDAMAGIFVEMAGRSDTQIMQDAWMYLWTFQQRRQDKPFHKARIYDFVKDRAPVWMVDKIINSMEASNMIERQAGTELYKAQPKHKHGGGSGNA